jgi:hypothetical protein
MEDTPSDYGRDVIDRSWRVYGCLTVQLSQRIFYTAMTEIRSIVEPDSIGMDIGREPVALASIHAGIASQTKLIWQCQSAA